MPERVTLDVVDRPAGGVRRTLGDVRALRRDPPAGLRAIFALGTAHFVPRPLPSPTPRRIAVLAAWGDEPQDLFPAGGREHWHVEAEVVRAAFSDRWRGWTPDATGARGLDDAEPALILISGELRARYVPAFAHDAAGAIAHAFGSTGYLGGLVFNSSPLNTTSCSCWRTYQDARTYAYRPGGHFDAMKRDRARGHHRTEYFLRLRPLRERGTLDGAAPFAGVLAQVAAH
jgi:hypothetical protein